MPHLTSPHLAQLISKLKEIFQINQPELDFGIYRILNSRAAEIATFLETTLPQKIQTALAGNAEQETAVYNHLFTFFSRYYDNGDFISQRRYKNDTYAIPYSGEEVMLHWANKDQYYTKSGENFSNYAFDLNGKKVHFRLVEADVAKDNRKDNEKDRVFVLAEPTIQRHIDENGEEIETDILPIEEKGDELIIRFEYKAMPKTGKKDKLQIEFINQAVEKLKNFAFQDEAYLALFSLMPTENDKERTLLKKYLQDYTTKNTADYFIHKNLGKFLNQELDFYIKNEVMNLDNIQAETAFSEIEQHLQQIKILKTVAQEIIAFLAQLEDFQKKLWLKKKFVAGTHYLITLDHLSDELIETALANPAQREQWQTLFNVNASGLNVEKLRENFPHLVVDTSLFEPRFQADVLKHIENLDEQTNGLLIHSDNFQALNLLQARYKEQVKCIYIDPPYNTGNDGFIYKDRYQHSSWLSLMNDRIGSSIPLLSEDGGFICSIDDKEQAHLQLLNNYLLGEENLINKITIKTKVAGVSGSHLGGSLLNNTEYAYLYSRNVNEFFISNAPKKKQELTTFIRNMESENKSWKYTSVLKSIDDGEYVRSIFAGNGEEIKVFKHSNYEFSSVSKIAKEEFNGDVDKVYYKYINSIFRTTNAQSSIRTRVMDETQNIDSDIVSIEYIPTKGKNANKKTRLYYKDKARNLVTFLSDVVQVDGNTIFKLDNKGNLWDDINYNNLANEAGVSFPNGQKPLQMMKDIINMLDGQIVLDFFAGSGTSGHAVIALNKESDINRKYILIEQGEYFSEILEPRIKKAIFSSVTSKQIVKVLKLESYEDTLNNLELRKPTYAFDFDEQVQNDYLLHYMLDVESRGSLLSTEHFAKPFDYELNIATSSAGAYQPQKIDLVETFNYLIGLRVNTVDDRRERGMVSVEGTLASGEKTLIIWRDVERVDYEALNRYLDSRDINPQDSEYDVVYINGDHNIPTVFADSDDAVKTLKVRSIEGEFLERMFS